MGVEMKSIALFMSPSLILITLFVENLNWRWTRNLFYSLKGQSSPILALTRSHWITFMSWWSEREKQKGTWEVVKHGERRFDYCALWNCFLLEDLLLKNYFCSADVLHFGIMVKWDGIRKQFGKRISGKYPLLSSPNFQNTTQQLYASH